jgi:riboflavin biosynthesis pyrimidine reductase
VRLAPGASPRPIILDTALRLPLTASLVQRQENPPWIMCSPAAAQTRAAGLLSERGCRILPCGLDGSGRIALKEALHQMWQLGLDSLMVEGGAGVITSILKERLFDWAVITIRPAWLGGLGAVAEGLEVEGRWPALQEVQVVACGGDLAVWGKAAQVAL